MMRCPACDRVIANEKWTIEVIDGETVVTGYCETHGLVDLLDDETKSA